MARRVVRTPQPESLEMPEKPSNEQPTIPEDLTSLDDSSLMSLFSRTVRWSEYLAGQLAEAEIAEKSAESLVDRTKVLLGVDGRSKDGRVAAANPKYTEAQDAYLEKHAYRKLVSVLYNASEGRSTLLSRELSRRTARGPRGAREERWGGA